MTTLDINFFLSEKKQINIYLKFYTNIKTKQISIHKQTSPYIHIAKLWGAEVPESVMNKVIKASEVANLAIVDREAFLSRELPKKYYNKNHSTDPKHARWHTHQDAIGIGVLMELVAGVELEHDPVYLKKRRQHGIDDTITFNPNCLVK